MKTKLLTLLVLACAGLVAGCAARRVSHDYIFDVTGVVTSEDGEPVQDADVTLDVNGPVYEGVTPVKSVKRLTNSTGGFVFGYISGESGVKYMLRYARKASNRRLFLVAPSSGAPHDSSEEGRCLQVSRID